MREVLSFLRIIQIHLSRQETALNLGHHHAEPKDCYIVLIYEFFYQLQ